MKFYLTTPIYYVNDVPHIGHAYATFITDIIARYHRMHGEDVFFLTGTDENSQKNVEAAHKADEQDVQDYVDRMSATWQVTWDELNVSNNDFIRTTEGRHITGVNKFWKKVEARGDIYKGKYEGLYCVGCEAFYLEKDLIDGNCPDHRKPPKQISEDNYFFKLTKYRDALLKYIESNPEFIQPPHRRQEVVNYITDHMTDISISRQSRGWGIPVPDDNSQVIYVWFDALLNYLTAVGYGADEEMFKKWWPADLHIIGKDLTKFHCALWPAMLMSAGLPLPKQVFAHGFFTIDGQKISKSLGNAIDPKDIVETYSVEVLRYFLMREIPFGADGDFSIERLAARYDADLANGLGNFVSRILAMSEERENLQPGTELQLVTEAAWQKYEVAFQSFKLNEALEAVWELLSVGDKYIEDKKPWEMKKDTKREEELDVTLGSLAESLRNVAWMIIPFFPDHATSIFKALGYPQEERRAFNEARQWGKQTELPKVNKIEPLFPRLDKINDQ